MKPEEFAVIDFETTGLSPASERIIEVACVIVRDGVVAEAYSQLMHPGRRISSFITELTGIDDSMLKGMPSPEETMPALKAFLGDRICVAHNASFDSGFYHAEMDRAGIAHERTFLCTMKLSRRLVDAPSHKLGSLAAFLNLERPDGMRAHRALADVMVTVELWGKLRRMITEKSGGAYPDANLCRLLMSKSKAAAVKHLDALALRHASNPA